jgi:hypothetical protein
MSDAVRMTGPVARNGTIPGTGQLDRPVWMKGNKRLWAYDRLVSEVEGKSCGML